MFVDVVGWNSHGTLFHTEQMTWNRVGQLIVLLHEFG